MIRLIVFTMCMPFILCGCKPEVIFQAEQENGSLKCTIASRNVRSVSKISFWNNDNGDYIWVIYNSFETLIPDEFLFGDLPGGFEQAYPERNKKPRSLAPGESIAVEIKYGYDELYAASMGTFVRAYRVSTSGDLGLLGEDEEIVYPSNYYITTGPLPPP